MSLSVLLIVYVFLCFYLYFSQADFIYFPDNQNFENCNGFIDTEKKNINGTRFYYKHNSNKLVVFYHGNAGSTCDRAYIKDKFNVMGYSSIFVEYSGYSNDDIEISKNSILNDVKNVNSFIENLDYKELVIVSESIGSGPLSFHTSLTKVDKIVMIAPFDELYSMAKEHYPLYPPFIVSKNNFDNKKYLSDFEGEVFIFHGEDDEVIPIDISKKLFDSLKTKNKEYKIIRYFGHNDIYYYEKMWNEIDSFLK